MKIAVSPANGSKNAWTVKKSAIASIFNATSEYPHHFGLNIPAGGIKKRLFSNLLGGLAEHITAKTDFRKDAAISKKRSSLLTFISPLDGRERCPKCSDKLHRGKS